MNINLRSRSDASKDKKFNPVTHVIFDLDGTLIDSERIHRKAVIRVVGEFGKTYPDDLHIKTLGTQEMDCATLIINKLQLDLSPREFLDRVYAIEEKELANVKFMHGAEQLLEHFRRHNIPMAVATSSSDKSFRMKTNHLQDQFSVFNHVVTGASDVEVENGKPAPDIFKICASRFPQNPLFNECLVFEDSPNGVTAAVAAGMQVVMVPDYFTPKKLTDNATLVLDSLEDFTPEMFSLPPYWVRWTP